MIETFPMKILIVSQYFWPETFKINDLCDALLDSGHEVTVLTAFPNYPDGHFFDGYGLTGPYFQNYKQAKIIRCPIVSRGKKRGLRLILNYISFFTVGSLFAIYVALKYRPDKIFVLGTSPITAAIPAIVAKWISGAPLFLWVQDLWPESLTATKSINNKSILRAVSKMVRWIYSQTDKILITSRGFVSNIKALGALDQQIYYFPQWAEPVFTQPNQETYQDLNWPTEQGFKLLFAGNIGIPQDFESIVQAAIHLKDHKHIYFIVLGDGHMKDWAIKEVEKNGLQKNFLFLGRKPLNTMPYYYRKADALLLTLKDEDLFRITVPAKLQSYLASGKPVLASVAGEGAEIIKNSESGIVCTPSQPRQMADCILKMSLLEKSQLNEMGQNALSYYKSQFDRDTLITQLQQLLRMTQTK